MRMFGAIVDGAGRTRARAEGAVTVEGDLEDLLKTTLFEFRKANPDTLLMSAMEEVGFEIRLGRTCWRRFRIGLSQPALPPRSRSSRHSRKRTMASGETDEAPPDPRRDVREADRPREPSRQSRSRQLRSTAEPDLPGGHRHG